MFGQELRTPINLLYGTAEGEQTFADLLNYVKALQSKMQTVHAFVRTGLKTGGGGGAI